MFFVVSRERKSLVFASGAPKDIRATQSLLGSATCHWLGHTLHPHISAHQRNREKLGASQAWGLGE